MEGEKCLPLPEIACNFNGSVCSIQDGQRRIAVAKELKRESIPVIVYYSAEEEELEHIAMSCEEFEKKARAEK